MGFAVFKEKPNSLQVRSFLGKTIKKPDKAPSISYLIGKRCSDARRIRDGAKEELFVPDMVLLGNMVVSP